MSQHCPVMIPNSKQEKHYINTQQSLTFSLGGLGFIKPDCT